GKDRMLVSDVPGTTRDSVDVPVPLGGVTHILVDSAGVRRRSRIEDSLERFSVNSSIKSSTKAQVTLLVLDGVEGLTQQDQRLLELLDGRKIPFMVLVNKMDLLERPRLKELEKSYREALAYCPHVPLLLVSAKDRRNLKKVLPLAREIMRESSLRLPTGRINRLLEDLLQTRQPPLIKGRRAKFHYLTQAETSPPTFVFFVSDPERVSEAYARYLERGLRKMLGIKHAPIRVHFRGRKGKIQK
ncbi:MAG: GTP-binding protein, partial [Desulfovibrionaceae bacterium]|nr:GTP-binding protein [Desulfovibrionaceae bacterium]